MRVNEGPYCFEQLHIDVARNSTDDFNPFHDPRRWQHIPDNPFGSTTVLGFQVSDLAFRQRRLHGELKGPEEHGLGLSNFEFRFAGVLKPCDRFDVDVRKTADKITTGGGLSNRVVVRKENPDLVLIGTQRETAEQRF